MAALYSLDSYRRLLDLALDRGRRFVGFAEASGAAEEVILRHDVDFSVEMALDMARVNAAAGVRGTFFLLLRSNVYNLLSAGGIALGVQIRSAGQSLGLHFPAGSPPFPSADRVAAAVRREYELLRAELPGLEPVYSWHNPNPAWMERFGALEPEGLTNAYHPRFTQRTCFRSDSNLRNSVEDFERILTETTGPLQLLFHPINWVAGGRDMIEIVAGTWRRVVRERETEFRTNRVYRERLPEGMPEAVLHAFAREWEAAARRGG
jgi:hypothetical protein